MKLKEAGTPPIVVLTIDDFTEEERNDLGIVLRRDQLNERGIQVIDGIMAYRNERVIARYVEDNGGTYEEAEEVYEAMLQYLAVAAITKGKRTPSKVIDEMWHAFILHMKDYRDFCEAHLRQIIYHDPAEDDNGYKFYPIARRCAQALFGELSERAWPEDHVRYERCISCCNAPANVFEDCFIPGAVFCDPLVA